MQDNLLPNINLWNNEVPAEIKNCENSVSVKKLLRKSIKPNEIYGLSYSRRASILMTRLRRLRNDLKKYLYEVNLCDDKICECGAETEDIDHYFLHCPLYDGLRAGVVRDVPIECWRPMTIFHGDDRYPKETNFKLNLLAQKFIIDSKCFHK